MEIQEDTTNTTLCLHNDKPQPGQVLLASSESWRFKKFCGLTTFNLTWVFSVAEVYEWTTPALLFDEASCWYNGFLQRAIFLTMT